MDGILLVNKEKGITSRDLVNQVSKNLNIKKVGHAGTLDPLATGLMILGVGKGTKILDQLTLDKKEYIATVKLGLLTDTLDITGIVVDKIDNISLSKQELLDVLKKFKKKYFQVVPIYSAVHVNGKRLYEYARNNIEVELPKREVEIFEIELLSFDLEKKEFKFRALVSKGCYIRSLIDDIGKTLGIPCTMTELVRTKSGKFTIGDISNQIIDIKDAIDFKVIKIDDELLKKVKNGNPIFINEEDDYLTLVDKDLNTVAIYKKEKKSNYRAFKVF